MNYDQVAIQFVQSHRFNVFGRHILAIWSDDGWTVFFVGSEGKRRPAEDILIPRDISESEVEQYLSDLCHEWASTRNPEVSRIT